MDQALPVGLYQCFVYLMTRQGIRLVLGVKEVGQFVSTWSLVSFFMTSGHRDIFSFLELKKNHGKEEYRARDLFYALWIPDLFMERVESNDSWTLFSPQDAPGLDDCYGTAFKELYESFECNDSIPKQNVKARQLWWAIMDSQIETGTPYMLYKDACNSKSNHNHLGVVKCSNLCAEIIQYSSPDQVAVCNLASIALPRLVVNGEFDFDKLGQVSLP